MGSDPSGSSTVFFSACFSLGALSFVHTAGVEVIHVIVRNQMPQEQSEREKIYQLEAAALTALPSWLLSPVR